MKNKEIEELRHMIDFYKKFCDGDGTPNPIVTGTEIRAIEKLLSYIEQLENNRDKAIEYINKTVFNEKGYINFCYELEKMLKGDSE